MNTHCVLHSGGSRIWWNGGLFVRNKSEVQRGVWEDVSPAMGGRRIEISYLLKILLTKTHFELTQFNIYPSYAVTTGGIVNQI